jgi:hypothetical protein
MSRPAEIDRFLVKFGHFGAEPSVASYLALFHPDATLFDSGMERPITVPEIPAHIEGILKLAQGFRMTPLRWRFREPTIFVEAHNRATLAGHPVEWPSVYAIDLAGDQVIRGRRYYDRAPLVAKVLPGGPAPRPPVEAPPIRGSFAGAGELVAACAQHAAARAAAFGVADLRVEIETWAGDEALVFVEWSASGSRGGHPLRFGFTDRVDLVAGAPKDARAYYDTLALAAR